MDYPIIDKKKLFTFLAMYATELKGS